MQGGSQTDWSKLRSIEASTPTWKLAGKANILSLGSSGCSLPDTLHGHPWKHSVSEYYLPSGNPTWQLKVFEHYPFMDEFPVLTSICGMFMNFPCDGCWVCQGLHFKNNYGIMAGRCWKEWHSVALHNQTDQTAQSFQNRVPPNPLVKQWQTIISYC